MARQTKAKETSRENIRDKDTFDYSTPELNPAARPVDAFAPTRPDLDAANAIVAIGEGLRSYGALSELRSQWKVEKATKDFAANQEKPPDNEKTKAYLDQWDKLKGNYSATVEFGQEVDKYFAENSHLEPDEFRQGYQEIVSKYTSGQNKEFMLGFFPQAVRQEQQLFAQYTQVLGNRLATQRNEMASQLMRDNIEGMLKTHVGADSLVQLEDDDFWVKNYLDDAPAFSRVWGNQMRTELSALQERYRDFGMDKTQVSVLMMEQAGRLAREYGVPELLDFAVEQDKAGNIRLTDNPELQQRYLTLKGQAESARDSRIAGMAQKKKKAMEDADSRYTSSVVARVNTLDPNDKQGAAAILQELLDVGEDGRMNLNRMPIGQQVAMTQFLDTSRRSLFASKTDSGEYVLLQSKFLDGNLQFTDLVEKMDYLTQEDYQAIFGLISRRSGEKNTAKTTMFTNTRASFKKFLSDKLDPKTTTAEGILVSLTSDGPSNLLSAMQFMDQALWDYVEQNGGQLPDRETTNTILEEVRKQYEKYFYDASELYQNKEAPTEVAPTAREMRTGKKWVVNANDDGTFNVIEAEDGADSE